MSNFKITRALIEAYVNNGFTIKMMADDITKQSGVKCPVATARHAAATYGINLRNKRISSHFILEDLDEVSNPVPNVISGPVGMATEVNHGGLLTRVEEPTVQL